MEHATWPRPRRSPAGREGHGGLGALREECRHRREITVGEFVCGIKK